MKQSNIFLVAGRTGGPLIPLLAIAKHLPEYKPIIIGVKKSFETTIATNQNLEIKYLPEAKLNLLSFKNQSLAQILRGVLDLLITIFLLALSFLKCCWLLLQSRPKAVFSAGSFLAVPVIYATFLLRKLGLIATKIIIHQQDPLPGLANKLTIFLADIKTCTFDYTKENYKNFQNCTIIPNPIDFDKFDSATIDNIQNPELKKFFKVNTTRTEHPLIMEQTHYKPIFLIFGGGSGAQVINQWVSDNLNELLENFRIIHLTGELQKENLPLNHGLLCKSGITKASTNYLTLPSLTTDMPATLKFSDLVLCRAGLGSITELQYLNKLAFLVPIPNSHQELNAELAKDRFVVLEQQNIKAWLNQIKETLPLNKGLAKQSFDWGFQLSPDFVINPVALQQPLIKGQKKTKTQLNTYYSRINELFAQN